MGGRRFVTPRQTCPRPEGLGRNLRSKTRWFTGFCNSHQVSHFATFFIDARAEISVAESRFRLYIAALLPNKHRLRYTRTSVCVRQHTQDVRGRPSAHTGRPAVHQYTYQHAPWTVRVILAHVGCLFSTHRTSVSTRRTSVAVRVCPCVRQCTQDVRQHTQDVRQHTQDVRGCPCVSVCPSVHTGRPSAHTGRPSAHAGRPSAHAGRPWLSVCVRVSVSAHRTSVSTHRTSVSTRRTSVAVRVCPCVRQHTQDVRQHTQDVRQHTQDVRAYPLAHTDCPWTDPCTELISAC
ncbi:hypothetical protein YC2023_003243 [Brassica napus]